MFGWTDAFCPNSWIGYLFVVGFQGTYHLWETDSGGKKEEKWGMTHALLRGHKVQ